MLPLAASGCTTPAGGVQAICAQAGSEPSLVATLFFGLRLPDGRIVDPPAWDAFMERSLTPRFPAGLTVLDGNGQWTAPDGTLVREPSRVVVIATRSAPDIFARLDAIRAEYRAQFRQQSVGLTLSDACASF